MTTATVSIDATAFNKAAAALSEAGFEEVAGPIVKHALRQSANVVRDSIKSAARRHRRTGRLERGVHTTWKGAGLAFQLRVSSTGSVAHLIAGGVRPHGIRAGDVHHPMPVGRMTGFAEAVRNPGFRGDPYFHRGVQASLPAITAIVEAAGAAMVKELAAHMRSTP